MLSQIHLCLLVLGNTEILFSVDICLEELVSVGMKDKEGCSKNSLCFRLILFAWVKSKSGFDLEFVYLLSLFLL